MAALKRYRVNLNQLGESAEEVREILCADDSDALMQCYAMLADYQSTEAWDGDRLVCRMACAGTLQSQVGSKKSPRFRPMDAADQPRS
jgi:hypothetical protein